MDIDPTMPDFLKWREVLTSSLEHASREKLAQDGEPDRSEAKVQEMASAMAHALLVCLLDLVQVAVALHTRLLLRGTLLPSQIVTHSLRATCWKMGITQRDAEEMVWKALKATIPVGQALELKDWLIFLRTEEDQFRVESL